MLCVELVIAFIRMCCLLRHHILSSLFFFTDTATTEFYTLSLHDALPISRQAASELRNPKISPLVVRYIGELRAEVQEKYGIRSEEHTSELQSRLHLVCRLLLEKKKAKAVIRRTQA